MVKQLFSIKSLKRIYEESEDESHALKKTLTALNLTTLGIGAIIGAGIFVLTGTAAATHAGPALVISFIISGLGCAFAGLCYAEFASMIPISGSAYTYAYATLGEFIAWIIGWDLILEYLFGAATVATGWSGYVTSFLHDLGIHLPDVICNAPFDYDVTTGWHCTGALINFPAVFILLLMASLLVIGIRESAKFNNLIVITKIIVILLFIGFGLSHINTANWKPFIPANTGNWGHYGWSGIIAGAGVIFFAYIGFDAVSTAAQEAKNPRRDMPIGILSSLVVCTILYILVSLVLTGIVNYKDLNVPAPMALAIDHAGHSMNWLRPLIKIGAIAGLSSVILVLLMGQARIFYSMAKDGLLPAKFATVHPKFRTPHITTIITSVAACVFAGLFPVGILGQLVSIGTLLAFTIVCCSVIILRRKRPHFPRPFKTPFVPWFPAIGAIICLTEMIFLPFDTWMRLIVWMLIGFVIYFTYSMKHSKVNNDNKN